jgi:hypothetical protein
MGLEEIECKIMTYSQLVVETIQWHELVNKGMIHLGIVSPCIIIHSNKSTNQIHQSLRFIARRSNTA